jgi:hypothetical protein
LICALTAALSSSATGCEGGEEGDAPPEWTVGELVDWHGKGALAKVDTDYGPLYVVRLQGTHYQMGYQYGRLLAPRMVGVWEHYLAMITAELGMNPGSPADIDFAEELMNTFLDECWAHMEPHTPQEYKEELQGVEDGFADAMVASEWSGGDIVRRILMLADVSQAHEMGDIGPMTRLSNDGYSEGAKEYFGMSVASVSSPLDHAVATALEDLFRRAVRPFRPRPMACSFFAAWGENTDGRLLASRNLDWASDIGLQHYRLITVFVPEGETPYVTIGYVGFMGALAGLSTKGIALGHVGSTNTLERLKAEPGLIKSREILGKAKNLDEALAYLSNEVEEGPSRPNSIGANAMAVYGDPEGGGAAAEGVALENTGIFTSVFRFGPGPECAEQASLLEFDEQGALAARYTHEDDPDIVNLEGDTYEIDASGFIRTFEVDANDEFVRDANGDLIDDPNGLPYRVGYPLPCAFFRGDEAMAYGVRKYQIACHGPRSDSDDKQMHRCGSYRGRYMVQHDMIQAYRTGASYVRDGDTIISDNGSVPREIGPEEAIAIASQAAMSSNVYSVVYDCTNLVIWVAYESGTGEDWVPASENTYFRLDLADLLPSTTPDQ